MPSKTARTFSPNLRFIVESPLRRMNEFLSLRFPARRR
jgi:hypothetical protein